MSIHSQRSLEGYMLIDHRASMGVPEEVMVAQGFPKDAGKQESIWETATVTCSQCERQVILNPDRSRPREWCKHCGHFHCDDCTAALYLTNALCYPFKAKCQDYLEAVDKGILPDVAFDSIFVHGMRPAQSVVLLDASPPAASQVSQSPLILP